MPTLSRELIDPGLVHLILVTDTVLLSTILQNHCWGDGLHSNGVRIWRVEGLCTKRLIPHGLMEWNVYIVNCCIRTINSLAFCIQGVLYWTIEFRCFLVQALYAEIWITLLPVDVNVGWNHALEH